MSKRRSLSITFSMLFLVLLLPVVAAAQYTRDDVFEKLVHDGLNHGDVASIVEGMAQNLPVRLDFPDISLSRNVGRRVNATAILEEVFKRIRPKIFVADADWDDKLAKTKESDDVSCTLRGRWRISIDGKSQLRDLYIRLEKIDRSGDVWVLMGLRLAPPEQ